MIRAWMRGVWPEGRRWWVFLEMRHMPLKTANDERYEQ